MKEYIKINITAIMIGFSIAITLCKAIDIISDTIIKIELI